MSTTSQTGLAKHEHERVKIYEENHAMKLIIENWHLVMILTQFFRYLTIDNIVCGSMWGISFSLYGVG